MLRLRNDSKIIIKDKEAFEYMCSFAYDFTRQRYDGKTEKLHLFDITKFMNENGFKYDDPSLDVIVNKKNKTIIFDTSEYILFDTDFIPFVLSRKYPRITIECISSSHEEDNEFSYEIKSLIKREIIMSQTILHWVNNHVDDGYTTKTETNNPADMINIDAGYIELLKNNKMEKNKITRYQIDFIEELAMLDEKYYSSYTYEVDNVNEIVGHAISFGPSFSEIDRESLKKLFKKRDYSLLEKKIESAEAKTYCDILKRISNAKLEECYELTEELTKVFASLGVTVEVVLKQKIGYEDWYNPKN